MRLDFDYPINAFSNDGKEIRQLSLLNQLEGYKSKDANSILSEHMDPPLSREIAKGHPMSIHIESGHLMARFSFHIFDKTDSSTIERLSQFVSGQILDGFGEGKYYPSGRSDLKHISYLAFPNKCRLVVPIKVNDGKKVQPPAPSKRLLWAAIDGDLGHIQRAISNRQKLDVKGKWNTTPLSLCVREKHVGCVRALLEAGADINLPLYDTTESTCPVQQNAMTGTYLLDWELRKDLPNDAQVLFEDERAIEIAKLLLAYGADFNRQITGSFMRPLQWTLNRKSWRLAEFYIQNGADPNFRVPYNGNTLLMEFPYVQCANLLIKHGLDLTHKNKAGQTTLEFIQAKYDKLETEETNLSESQSQKLKETISVLKAI